ncbi:hypothetical protein GOV10_01150 [Candidatus Woesearchaeota archaeon]|nr:hypothetical protein [Candidatus Woesearchaeota archaeon]
MKRGQLQSMETIIIVIILVLLTLMGIWFFAKATDNQIESTSTKLKLATLQTTGKKLSYLPELSCQSGGAETELCIDIIKAEILSEWLTNSSKDYHEELRIHYYQMFGDTRITIQQVYPEDFFDPESNDILLFNGTTSLSVYAQALPISLYNPIDGQTYLGVLYAETE